MAMRQARLRAVAVLVLLMALLVIFFDTDSQSPPITTTSTESRHLALGNPSGAVASVREATNYLIVRDQYALAYHREQGLPNWVAWHLEARDLGGVERYSGSFIADPALPEGWYRVSHGDYTNSGYDRGHMTPSGDRTATEDDNIATFLLTNVVPQAPENNRGIWVQLEEHTRRLVREGNEVYIVAGVHGSLGTLADGRLTIPASVWKVLLVLPAAPGDDAARVTEATEVIAVWTPNDASVGGSEWEDYRTSVRCIEERTGLDFFAAVRPTVQALLEGPGC